MCLEIFHVMKPSFNTHVFVCFVWFRVVPSKIIFSWFLSITMIFKRNKTDKLSTEVNTFHFTAAQPTKKEKKNCRFVKIFPKRCYTAFFCLRRQQQIKLNDFFFFLFSISLRLSLISFTGAIKQTQPTTATSKSNSFNDKSGKFSLQKKKV